ncbi:MAG: hypothetical protein ABI977_23705 [Acidobacteriota bacterium]
MQTETLEVTGLRTETIKAIGLKARQAGKTVSEYVRDVIETEVAADQTFAQILEPIRQSFDESGMTETELDELVEAAREEVWQAKQTGGIRTE